MPHAHACSSATCGCSTAQAHRASSSIAAHPCQQVLASLDQPAVPEPGRCLIVAEGGLGLRLQLCPELCQAGHTGPGHHVMLSQQQQQQPAHINVLAASCQPACGCPNLMRSEGTSPHHSTHPLLHVCHKQEVPGVLPTSAHQHTTAAIHSAGGCLRLVRPHPRCAPGS